MLYDPEADYNNPANTAYNGEYVATIVGEWQAAKFQPIELDSADLGINPNSLRNRLTYGLKWLCRNAKEEDRPFWIDIHDTIEIRIRAGSSVVSLYRNKAPTAQVRLVSDNRWLDVCSSFTRWCSSDPRLRSQWRSPLNFHNDDQLQWFRTKQQDLDRDNRGFASVIRQDNVTFMRIPT